MTRATRSREFTMRIVAELSKAADQDCKRCLGAGVIDVGRGDREELVACKCVAIKEKDDEHVS